MAALTRDPCAPSIDEQHPDYDEPIDHLSASLGHVHDRENAIKEHEQHARESGRHTAKRKADHGNAA